MDERGHHHRGQYGSRHHHAGWATDHAHADQLPLLAPGHYYCESWGCDVTAPPEQLVRLPGGEYFCPEHAEQ